MRDHCNTPFPVLTRERPPKRRAGLGKRALSDEYLRSAALRMAQLDAKSASTPAMPTSLHPRYTRTSDISEGSRIEKATTGEISPLHSQPDSERNRLPGEGRSGCRARACQGGTQISGHPDCPPSSRRKHGGLFLGWWDPERHVWLGGTPGTCAAVRPVLHILLPVLPTSIMASLLEHPEFRV